MTPVQRPLATTSSLKTPRSYTLQVAFYHKHNLASSCEHMLCERNVTGQSKALTSTFEWFARRSNMFECPIRREKCRMAYECCSKFRIPSLLCVVGNSIKSQLSPCGRQCVLNGSPAGHTAPDRGTCGFMIGTPSTHLGPSDIGSSMHAHCSKTSLISNLVG